MFLLFLSLFAWAGCERVKNQKATKQKEEKKKKEHKAQREKKTSESGEIVHSSRPRAPGGRPADGVDGRQADGADGRPADGAVKSARTAKKKAKAKAFKSCFAAGKIPVTPYTQDSGPLDDLAKAHGKSIDAQHPAAAKDPAKVEKIVCACWVDFTADGIKDLVMRVTYKHSAGWQIEPDHLLFFKKSRKPMSGKTTGKKKPYKEKLVKAGFVSLAGEALFAKRLQVLNPGGGVAVAFGVRSIHQYTNAPAFGLYAYRRAKITRLALVKTPGCSVDSGGCGKCKAKVEAAKNLPSRVIALKGSGQGFLIVAKGFRLKNCVPTPCKKTYRLVKGKLKATKAVR